MKVAHFLVCLLCVLNVTTADAQTAIEAKPDKWTVYNRKVDFDKDVIHLDAMPKTVSCG